MQNISIGNQMYDTNAIICVFIAMLIGYLSSRFSRLHIRDEMLVKAKVNTDILALDLRVMKKEMRGMQNMNQHNFDHLESHLVDIKDILNHAN